MLAALPFAVPLGGYLIGSIPFSYLVVRLFAGADIREHGSRNVGATNVARSFGKLPGILALILDIAKGWSAVALARWLSAQPGWPLVLGIDAGAIHSAAFWAGFGALAAVIGHMFPIWLRFHGGKGVATATGAYLALDPLSISAALVVFLIVIVSMRFVSLASMLAAAAVPIFLRFFSHAPLWTLVFSILIAMLIIMKHHSNLARLVQGTERRIGEPRS
jgi:glycerol-3-phosphate acyltransferase PlsY